MRGRVGHVGEKRRAVAPVGLDELDHLVGVGLRRIEIPGQLLDRAPVFGVRRHRSIPFEVPLVVEVTRPARQQ